MKVFPVLLLTELRDLLVEMIKDLSYALMWVSEVINEPRKIGSDISLFFSEISHSLGQLHVMWSADPQRAIENFIGGFLIYVVGHRIEFTSQLILLLFAGGAVFHSIDTTLLSMFATAGIAEVTSSNLLRNVNIFYSDIESASISLLSPSY